MKKEYFWILVISGILSYGAAFLLLLAEPNEKVSGAVLCVALVALVSVVLHVLPVVYENLRLRQDKLYRFAADLRNLVFLFVGGVTGAALSLFG